MSAVAKTVKKAAQKPAPKSAKPARPNARSPYTVETFMPREAIGYLITRVKTALWEEADRALAPLDLTLSQWVVIANLSAGTMSTPAEICKAISYDAGAMTRLLDRLEKKGFIRRVRHTGDRRSVTLELTRAGRDLYPNLVSHMVVGLNRVLAGFTAAEARQLESMLKRILVNVGDTPSPPPKPGAKPAPKKMGKKS